MRISRALNLSRMTHKNEWSSLVGPKGRMRLRGRWVRVAPEARPTRRGEGSRDISADQGDDIALRIWVSEDCCLPQRPERAPRSAPSPA
jgi:hypothetical protein